MTEDTNMLFTVQFDLKLELRDNRADDVVWVMGIYLVFTNIEVLK